MHASIPNQSIMDAVVRLHRGQDRLPLEIWTEIFNHLPLRSDILVRLSGYCQTFYAAARHLVFSEFYCRQTRSDESVRARNLAVLYRLRCWCTDDISRFVRRCVISVGHAGIFYALPHFRRLETLELTGIKLEQSHVRAICRTDTLTELHVTLCRCAASEDRVLSTPSPLTVRCCLKRVWIAQSPRCLSALRPLLLPAHLVDLRVASRGFGQLFNADNHHIPTFPLVRVLWIGSSWFTSAEILAKFPAVEVLRLAGCIGESTGQELFPKLKSFTGKYTNLRSFASPARLQRISLPVEDPDVIISIHDTYPRSNSLSALTAQFNTITNTQLDRVLAHWTNLTEANIYIGAGRHEMPNEGHCADTFITCFTSSPALPASLSRLALRWVCDEPSVHKRQKASPPFDSTPASRTYLYNLLSDSRCSKLNVVWLESCDYLLHWRRDVEEPASATCINIHHNTREIQAMRDVFPKFWDEPSL
ncbi:hypothetical protein C8F01DRAFT_1148838 [Mycena amicta]|nr:hypothetical protein C8F01DRAFT_1148838 [Mycena amicta]